MPILKHVNGQVGTEMSNEAGDFLDAEKGLRELFEAQSNFRLQGAHQSIAQIAAQMSNWINAKLVKARSEKFRQVATNEEAFPDFETGNGRKSFKN